MSGPDNGRKVACTERAFRREWDTLDALPPAVRAALFDAVSQWRASQVAELLARHGKALTIRLIVADDRLDTGNARLWMRPEDVRAARRSKAPVYPPSPHVAARATQLRSHAARYLEHLA